AGRADDEGIVNGGTGSRAKGDIAIGGQDGVIEACQLEVGGAWASRECVALAGEHLQVIRIAVPEHAIVAGVNAVAIYQIAGEGDVSLVVDGGAAEGAVDGARDAGGRLAKLGDPGELAVGVDPVGERVGVVVAGAGDARAGE